MTRYYQKPKETGREFVDYCSELCSITIHRCIMLPHRWESSLLNPLITTAQKIEELVITANSIYINKEHLSEEEYLNNYERRLEKLTEALDYFKLYDVQFSRTMENVDLEQSEIHRLEDTLRRIIEKEDRDQINIEIQKRSNKYCYISKSGKEFLTLKLTHKNVEYWIYVRNKAREVLSKRINADRKNLKSV